MHSDVYRNTLHQMHVNLQLRVELSSLYSVCYLFNAGTIVDLTHTPVVLRSPRSTPTASVRVFSTKSVGKGRWPRIMHLNFTISIEPRPQPFKLLNYLSAGCGKTRNFLLQLERCSFEYSSTGIVTRLTAIWFSPFPTTLNNSVLPHFDIL